MEQELLKKIEEQGAKIDAIFTSVEKTRKYFRTVMWVSILAIVIPIIGLSIVIPQFINTYTSSFNL